MSVLDEQKKAFGSAAGLVIHKWAEDERTSLEVDEVLTNGRSGARVAVVTEQPSKGHPQKLLVKVCAPDDEGRPREGQRHHLALDRFPEFAKAHLVSLVHPSLPVGNGELVMFQELAGTSEQDMRPLAWILDNVAAEGPADEGGADDLALSSAVVVRSVLEDWGKHQRTAGRTEKVTVPAFLRQLLGRRLPPGGSLHTWATAHAGALVDRVNHWIVVDGEVLLNPMALTRDDSLFAGRRLRPFLGPVHRDLHEENTLVAMEDLRRARGRSGQPKLAFRLIDLSAFEERAPLAYDPVHMLLSMVVRHLDRLTPAQQMSLARFIVDPRDPTTADQVPGWLRKLVSAFHGATPRWLDKFAPEWREQTLLSMAACGLVYACRRTTADAHRLWLVRLAAMAATAAGHHAGVDRDTPGPTEVRSLELRLETTPRASTARTAAPEVRPAADQRAADEARSTSPVVEALPGRDAATVELEDDATCAAVPDRRAVAHLVPLELRSVADELMERVLCQLRDMAERRRLVHPGPIRVRWAKPTVPVVGPASDAVGGPGYGFSSALPGVDAPGGPLPTSGDAAGLFRLYCGVRSRMVIVGQPGAGKTAAGIRLALDVLVYRKSLPDEERAGVAVPVILTPHDWDPGTPLKTWIIRALVADHPQLSDERDGGALARLVEGGHVALFFDALDDMPESSRAQALRSIDGQSLLRVVVLSRSAEMVTAAAKDHLTSAAAAELQPVEPEEEAAYLARWQTDPMPREWAALVDELRDDPDGPVAQALDSPLMLRLLRHNYHDQGDVRELLDAEEFPTRVEVERHLLGGVLPAAYERASEDPPIHHSVTDAQRWLGFIAHHMRKEGTRDLAWWRLPRALPWGQRVVVQAFVTGFLPSVSLGVLGALGGHPVRGLLLGFAFGPAAVLFDMLIVHGKERGPRDAGRRIALGYVLICAVTGAFSGSLLVGVARGAVRGLLAGLAVGLGAGILSVRKAVKELGADARPTAGAGDDVLRPVVYWRQDRRRALWFGSILALLLAVTLAGVCLAVAEPLVRIGPAVVLEAALMLVFAITLSPRAQTQLAVLQLWLGRKAPRRLIPFLEEALRLDVLRSAGPVYQFRHARLQDLLAERYEAEHGEQPTSPPG